MALSNEAKKRVVIAVTDDAVGAEISTAIDANESAA